MSCSCKDLVRNVRENSRKILFCSRYDENNEYIILSRTAFFINSIKFVVLSLAVHEVQKQSSPPSATYFSKSGHAYLGAVFSVRDPEFRVR